MGFEGLRTGLRETKRAPRTLARPSRNSSLISSRCLSVV